MIRKDKPRARYLYPQISYKHQDPYLAKNKEASLKRQQGEPQKHHLPPLENKGRSTYSPTSLNLPQM